MFISHRLAAHGIPSHSLECAPGCSPEVLPRNKPVNAAGLAVLAKAVVLQERTSETGSDMAEPMVLYVLTISCQWGGGLLKPCEH